MVGTGSSVFSSLPNPSVICCPAPGITSPMGFVWEEEELLDGHSLLQRIFLTQGLNLGPPMLWADSLPPEPPGKPFPSSH